MLPASHDKGASRMTDTLTTELRAKAELDEICKRLDSAGLLVAEIRGHLLVGNIEAAMAVARKADLDLTRALSGVIRIISELDQHNGR
ncbi:hypothetical protein RHWG_00051 [Rhodobacter phage RC1]|uniref:hypothetical protein n=1 Tax=Rhodobacter phage RC1 TaxID=754055 RepID=UPI0002C18043|nr:hypothetical protein RHWG_00051 [Rhodobacter phage RC1]AGH58072.1 hypothetical protein RHWG_00051 [Rhodobacter phage RC1]